MIKDLTVGKPQNVLWRFSLPLFMSAIFQQLYSIADSVIVGKFVGENALAAVGASYPVTMIFIAIAIGSNIGCAVVISSLFGEHKYRQMKTAIFTTLISITAMALILTAVGISSSKILMHLLDTPSNIFVDSRLYLNIYIGGLLFQFLYNVCNGVFTSLGDSKTPLYFLIGSSVGNVILDLIFVVVLHMGVAGVAWATFLAQGIACLLSCITLLVRIKTIRTEPYQFFSFPILGSIARIAVPSILQQSFISIGNIFIQRLINGYGSSVIAGYSSAIKINTFATTCMTTLANGLSSFAAQNFGAKKFDRVRQGLKSGFCMALVIAVFFTLLYCIFSRQLIAFFMESSKNSYFAIDTGRTFLLIVTPFYFAPAIKLMADNTLRGIRSINYFMISTFFDLVLRVILSYILSPIWGTIGIWISWPIGWVLSTIMSLIFCRLCMNTLENRWTSS